jgi:branched-chain amino acid transport system substrate-binding protein
VAIAFLRDLAPEGSFERTLPALQAVELAVAAAALDPEGPVAAEVVPFDTQGDRTTTEEVVTEIVGDPRFVAAIAGPELPAQRAILDALAAADVPLISLSGRQRVDGASPGTWLRLVASDRAHAEAVAATAASLRRARDGVCVATPPADGVGALRTVLRSLPADVDATEVAGAAEVREAGCGVVVWTGAASEGADLAVALAGLDPPAPRLIGGPALRDPVFLAVADQAAEGAISLCSCADLSTSLELHAQRFIQDYQSEYGRPPGPGAVEAWDAAQLVIDALRDGATVRGEVVDRLGGVVSLDGLGGTYVFSAGELADPWSAIRPARVAGGRWIEIAGR